MLFDEQEDGRGPENHQGRVVVDKEEIVFSCAAHHHHNQKGQQSGCKELLLMLKRPVSGQVIPQEEYRVPLGQEGYKLELDSNQITVGKQRVQKENHQRQPVQLLPGHAPEGRHIQGSGQVEHDDGVHQPEMGRGPVLQGDKALGQKPPVGGRKEPRAVDVGVIQQEIQPAGDEYPQEPLPVERKQGRGFLSRAQQQGPADHDKELIADQARILRLDGQTPDKIPRGQVLDQRRHHVNHNNQHGRQHPDIVQPGDPAGSVIAPQNKGSQIRAVYAPARFFLMDQDAHENQDPGGQKESRPHAHGPLWKHHPEDDI